jgi:hypothetical protein
MKKYKYTKIEKDKGYKWNEAEYKKAQVPYTQFEPNSWIKKQEIERNTKFKAFCKKHPELNLKWFTDTTKMFNSEMVSIWLVILFSGLNEFVYQDLQAGTDIYLYWNIVKAMVWTNLVLNFIEYKPNRKL